MKLGDIIKTEFDRIFVVTPECFIIFTGDSLEDSRPFIRIGNWIDLPVEIIPLIENIIVADNIIGNPSHEQFNIDIKYLPTNRYIGSQIALKKYLKYQKIYNLDLFNASVVNAEKDIPELSKNKKNISDRDSFIGVFYSDGNFIVNHSNKKVFNLFESINNPQVDSNIHENLAENAKGSRRYENSGFLVIDNNPIFYKNNSMTSYLFPDKYYREFNELNINPKNINAVLHPSDNFLNISRFLKWKNQYKNRIKIFSDFKEENKLIKDLFCTATIGFENFHNFSHDTSTGMTFKNYHHSYNISINDKIKKSPDMDKEELAIAYIKGASQAKNIIKDKFDFIMINYSVYEDNLLLFKQSNIPHAIIDDGNSNINKLSKTDNIIINQNIQYEFQYFELENFIDFQKDILKDLDFSELTIGETITAIENSLSKNRENSEKLFDSYNLISLLQFYNKTTNDRKLNSTIKNLIQQNYKYLNLKEFDNLQKIKVVLSITPVGVFQTIVNVDSNKSPLKFIPDDFKISPGFENDKENRKLFEKITEDRKRLNQLLKLFYSSGKLKDEVKKLKSEIEKRKEHYKEDHIIDETPSSKGLLSRVKKDKKVQKSSENIQSDNHSPMTGSMVGNNSRRGSAGLSNSSENFSSKLKLLIKILFVILLLGLLLWGGKKGYNYFKEYKKTNEDKESQEIKNQSQEKRENSENKEKSEKGKEEDKEERNKNKENNREEESKQKKVIAAKKAHQKLIIKKYKVRITNQDILIYANKIAKLNGYAPISKKSLRKRNPNWIFPGNTFTLPDEEKIIVDYGHTLWGISHKKLIELNYKFFSTYDIIKEKLSKGEEINPQLMDNLVEYAETKEKKRILNRLQSKIKNNR